MMDLSVGDVIKAGTFVLLTSGSYSSYGVTGLFRATKDTTVPGRQRRYGASGALEPDNAMLSTLLEEVPHMEAWQDD